jgi:hypothetical protein
MRFFAIAALLLVACHRQPPPAPETSRAVAVLVPPPVEEMTRVRARMWLLAREVRLLAMLTDAPDQADSDAIEHLDRMQQIAEEIAVLPERSNHPILDDNITGLISDIKRAKAEVAGAEPETGMTRSITTVCVRCHELRTCPFDSYQQCIALPVY